MSMSMCMDICMSMCTCNNSLTYICCHVLQLILQRGVHSLRDEIRLDLAPLTASPDADDQRLAVLPLRDQAGGQEEAILVPRLLQVIRLTREGGLVAENDSFVDEDAVCGDAVACLEH